MPGGISGDADRSTLYALARKKFSEAPPSSWRSAGSSRSDGSGGRAAPKPTSGVGLETLAEAENVSSPSSQSRMRKRASSIAWVEVDEEKISPKLGARALNEVFFMLRGWVLQSVLALLFTYLSYRVAKLGFQSATAVFCSRISYEVAVFILLNEYAWKFQKGERLNFLLFGTLHETILYIGAYFLGWLSSKTPLQISPTVFGIFTVRMFAIVATADELSGLVRKNVKIALCRPFAIFFLAFGVTACLILICNGVVWYRYATILLSGSLAASTAITGVLYPFCVVSVRFLVENVVIPIFYKMSQRGNGELDDILESYSAVCRMLKLCFSLPSVTSIYYVFLISTQSKSKRFLFFFISLLINLGAEIVMRYVKILKITHPKARLLQKNLSFKVLREVFSWKKRPKHEKPREVSVEIQLNEIVTFDAAARGVEETGEQTADQEQTAESKLNDEMEQELELKFLAVRVISDNYAERIAVLTGAVFSCCLILTDSLFSASSWQMWRSALAIVPLALSVELFSDWIVWKMCEMHGCMLSNVKFYPRIIDLIGNVLMSACVFTLMLLTDAQFSADKG